MTTLDLLKNETDTVLYEAGQQIFSTGDAGDVMYAVIFGEVEIIADDEVLETVEPGGVFGEMALVDQEPRSASAVAKTDCELVRIDENRFNLLVKFNPFFALEVLRVTVQRLRRLTLGSGEEALLEGTEDLPEVEDLEEAEEPGEQEEAEELAEPVDLDEPLTSEEPEDVEE